jgi:hypothetical protein
VRVGFSPVREGPALMKERTATALQVPTYRTSARQNNAGALRSKTTPRRRTNPNNGSLDNYTGELEREVAGARGNPVEPHPRHRCPICHRPGVSPQGTRGADPGRPAHDPTQRHVERAVPGRRGAPMKRPAGPGTPTAAPRGSGVCSGAAARVSHSAGGGATSSKQAREAKASRVVPPA